MWTAATWEFVASSVASHDEAASLACAAPTRPLHCDTRVLPAADLRSIAVKFAYLHAVCRHLCGISLYIGPLRQQRSIPTRD
jgi:hypothetical protein